MDITQAATKIQSKVRQIQASTKFKELKLKELKLKEVPINIIGRIAGFTDADTMLNIKTVCQELNKQISLSMIYHTRIIEERRQGQTNAIRLRLANNPNLHLMSEDIARILSTDANASVRDSLARNLNL